MKGTDEGTAEVASSQRVNKGDPSVNGEGDVGDGGSGGFALL